MAPMSDDHKAAIARSREEANAVKNYLSSLSTPKGRAKTVTVAQVAELKAAEVAETNPLKKLDLTQKRLDAEAIVAVPVLDRAALERGFVAKAAPYSDRKGISSQAWRAMGVPSDVLKKAGLK